MSVVGFDDSALMTCTDPPLTTVRQPIEMMGQAAVDLLVNQIEGVRRAAPTSCSSSRNWWSAARPPRPVTGRLTRTFTNVTEGRASDGPPFFVCPESHASSFFCYQFTSCGVRLTLYRHRHETWSRATSHSDPSDRRALTPGRASPHVQIQAAQRPRAAAGRRPRTVRSRVRQRRAATATPKASDGPVTIVINGLPPDTEKANHDRSWRTSRSSRSANPNIKIDAREGKMDPQTFPAKLAGGQLEDVFYVYFTDPASLIAKKPGRRHHARTSRTSRSTRRSSPS